MKSDKFYSKIVVAVLVTVLVVGGYVYLHLFKAPARVSAEIGDRKEDTRKPPDIVVIDDSNKYENVETKIEKATTSVKTTSEEAEKEVTNIDIGTQSVSEKLAIRDRTLSIIGKKKEDVGGVEVKRLDDEFKLDLPELKSKEETALVLAKYAYLNEEKEEYKEDEEASAAKDMARYFRDKELEADLTYLNEGETWYQGGKPKTDDVKVENGKKLIYIYGYGWLPWSVEHEGTVIYEEDYELSGISIAE